MSSIVVIPARYASTRFPGKPLALLKGKPVIQHVYENSIASSRASEVIVATDSETIFEKVLSFGGKPVMTSEHHASGTDRIAEVAAALEAYDIIVNVQGDEPLIRPGMIDDVIEAIEESGASIGTLAKKITNLREIFDPNVVKVVFDQKGLAFYFSRAPIPYHRDAWAGGLHSADGSGFEAYKHIGIYSYRRDTLMGLSKLPPSKLEIIERLEQLRALENGYSIRIVETDVETIGVDTPEDLERIENA